MKKEEMQGAFVSLVANAKTFYATVDLNDENGKLLAPLHQIEHSPLLLLLFDDGKIHSVDASSFLVNAAGKKALGRAISEALAIPHVVATCLIAEAYSGTLGPDHTPEDRAKLEANLKSEKPTAAESLIFSFRTKTTAGIGSCTITRVEGQRPTLSDVAALAFDDGSMSGATIAGRMHPPLAVPPVEQQH